MIVSSSISIFHARRTALGVSFNPDRAAVITTQAHLESVR